MIGPSPIPNLRFTTIRVFGAMRMEATDYICGLNTRSESRSCLGHSDAASPTNVTYEYGPLRAHILNRDLGYGFVIEPAAGLFTASRVNVHGSPTWMKPRRMEPPKPSGKTVHNHIETIDTGERRELFGYAARHVITKSRQTRDSELESETERDGWYINPPAAWLNVYPPPKAGTFYYLASSTSAWDDHKFTEVGKRETGFALLTTLTHKSWFNDEMGSLRTSEDIHREEVIAYSEAPLQPDLFVPPRSYQRVPWFPGEDRYLLAYRMRLRWETWKDSFSLPYRIAEFATEEGT